MNNELHLNRRQFLRSSGQAAATLAAASTFAPSILSVESPTTTIGVGCIGLGTRGGDLLEALAHAPNVKVTAVSDVYGPHRRKGLERCLNPEAKAYVDYRELLADKNVDAMPPCDSTTSRTTSAPLRLSRRATNKMRTCPKATREARLQPNPITWWIG